MAGVSFDMAKPLRVLTAADTTLPAAADSTLGDALAAGGLAVVPGDLASARTWWQLTPDGTTRSILAPRLGGTDGLGKLFRGSKDVLPPSKAQPGGNGKGQGGPEYNNVLKVQKQVAPTVQKAGHAGRSSFETAAETAARLMRKKLGGG